MKSLANIQRRVFVSALFGGMTAAALANVARRFHHRDRALALRGQQAGRVDRRGQAF